MIIQPIDLHRYLGVDGDQPSSRVTYLAERASKLVTEAWRTPVEDVPFWVEQIALDAASRAYWNPDGVVQSTKSLDDGSITKRRSETPSGKFGLYLTDDEKAQLAGVVAGGYGFTGSVPYVH